MAKSTKGDGDSQAESTKAFLAQEAPGSVFVVVTSEEAGIILTRILQGPSRLATVLLQRCMHPYVFGRSEIGAYLESPDIGDRAEGLARACVELGSAGNPVSGENLARVLLPAFQLLEAAGADGRRLQIARLAVSYALGQALLRQGKFDQLCELVDAWHRSSYLGLNPSYDASFLVQKAHALALQLRIPEARAILGSIADLPFRSKILGCDEALQLVSKYEIWPERHVEPFDRAQAIREVFQVTSTLGANLTDWETKLLTVTMGTALEVPTRGQLTHLRSLHTKLEAFKTRSDLDAPETGAQIHLALYEFQTAARDLLSGDPRSNGLELQQVADHINYGAMIEGSPRATSDVLRGAIDRVQQALAWSTGVGALHHQIDALYLLNRLYQRLPAGTSQAFEYAKTLFDNLAEARKSPLHMESVLSFTGTHRGLFPFLTQWGFSHSDTALVNKVLEFRKGTLLDQELVPADAIDNSAFEPLGPRTHYVNFAVLEEDDAIFFLLRSPSGIIEATALSVTAAEIRCYVQMLDPVDWNRVPLFGPGVASSPYRTFSRLMAGLESAVTNGTIGLGDHLVIAAEDPVVALPLHLLPLAGEPAYRRVTMSRSASFADARRTYLSPRAIPRVASAVFVPAQGENDIDQKREAHILSLPPMTLQRSVEGEEADIVGVLSLFPTSELLHVMAHGQRARRGENPIDSAGVRLARDGKLPRRTGQAEALLSPRAILGGPRLPAGAHVSLLACVTGLAKRGEAGDNLGLELALRQRGAASVLASHWHVDWQSAVEFMRVFYEAWLGLHTTRAEAWRRANEQVAKMAFPRSPLSGAFSLYGDWR